MDRSLSGSRTCNVYDSSENSNSLFSYLLPAVLGIEPRTLCIGKNYSYSYIPDTIFFLLIAMTDGWCNQENLFLSLTVSVCKVKGITEHVTVRQETETETESPGQGIVPRTHPWWLISSSWIPHSQVSSTFPENIISWAPLQCTNLNGWGSSHPDQEENMTALQILKLRLYFNFMRAYFTASDNEKGGRGAGNNMYLSLTYFLQAGRTS